MARRFAPRWISSVTGGVLVSVLVLGACAPTARTLGPYRAKAAKTAEALESAVASDLLVIESVKRRHPTAAYVSVATSQAEDDASTAASSFLSIDPPGGDEATKLRDDLSDLVDQAQSAMGDVRIAGHRGDRAQLLEQEPPLRDLVKRLHDFADGAKA
jgi:hypothetical protein